MENYISELIMATLTFVVGYVETKRNKEQKRSDAETKRFRERQEERAEVRRQEAALAMKLALTNSELSDVIANAVSGGKSNGNVTQARKNAQIAREEYEKFVQDQACKQITKY